MYSNVKWISNFMSVVFITLVLSSGASAQIRVYLPAQSFLPPDEARDVYNAGKALYDESRYADAENKFREVVRRFPKNSITDRADYWLIRTLAQLGKKTDALNRIDAFAKQYPKSPWLDDVQEFRIQLTNQIPPRAERILLTSSPAPAAPPAPPNPFAGGQGVAIPPIPPLPPLPFVSVDWTGFQTSDPEISLQQEVLRALFHNNVDHAIEIATERLKVNPADPVVLASLNLVASSRSAQAMSMLLGIVKSSSNAKARRDAIYWLGQSRGDRDAIVDTLTGLLPSLSEDDSEAVTFSLSQIRTEKSLNALATLARDKSKNEKVRNNAVFWIAQSRVPNRVGLLEDIYKNSMDNAKIRQQVMFALSQTREPQAVTIIGNVAQNDPDVEVRKQAVFWLGQSRSPEANQALEKLLQKK
ncbi:MAG TPA: HEAT repeat domain-containing protein [Terriglobia bacterium]|nr:HEAT repeat domain-containing protein [Terriglobia bacterium]